MKKGIIMLDYDGTLAPFKVDRQKAFLHPQIKSELELLLQNNNIKVIILSGRALKSLIPLIDLSSVPELWGCHGLERLSEEGKYTKEKISSRQKKGLLLALKSCEDLLSSKHYELKPFSVAVHVRGLPPLRRKQILNKISVLWEKLIKNFDLEFMPFKQGCEIRIKNKNKGTAVNKILQKVPKNTEIVYLGDDLTDEDAFVALGNRGLKVLVGKALHASSADLRLETHLKVAKFLKKWRESIKC